MNAPPFAGMQVGSSVVLKHPLSRGGMGEIWVGEHRGLEIDVAVKFLSAEFARDQNAAERFKREAGAAARVKSPHIVSVFDQGLTDDGLPFIVMELLDGEDLGQRVERLGPRPLYEIVTIVNQLARALGAAHSQGIVHRDIKPENVFLIDADGEPFVKLLDFGVAKRVTDDALSVTRTGIMMGTPHFMSPEQVMSAKDVDAFADLWSLGATVYVALTGRVPFQGETLGAVCYAIVAGEFEPVTAVRSDLPQAIDAWFDRALHREPTARFESVRQMAAELELAARGSSRRSGTPEFPRVERSTRGAPLVARGERAERGGSSSGSPHPTKFEATVGIAPPVKRKSHVFATLVSIVVGLAFASVVGAALFMSPEQLDELKATFTRSAGESPNPTVHSNLPGGPAPASQPEEPPSEERDAAASPSRVAAKKPESAKHPTVRPGATVESRVRSSKSPAPAPLPDAEPTPWRETVATPPDPEPPVEPARPAPEDPYALPRADPVPPYGSDDTPQEPAPRPDDERDYGL